MRPLVNMQDVALVGQCQLQLACLLRDAPAYTWCMVCKNVKAVSQRACAWQPMQAYLLGAFQAQCREILAHQMTVTTIRN